jgi:branched-subunit amino acid transport protein
MLGRRRVPELVDRFLIYVPVTELAALVTPNLGTGMAA